jgi:GTPase involved in cell partitioning and DNA repair
MLELRAIKICGIVGNPNAGMATLAKACGTAQHQHINTINTSTPSTPSTPSTRQHHQHHQHFNAISTSINT